MSDTSGETESENRGTAPCNTAELDQLRQKEKKKKKKKKAHDSTAREKVVNCRGSTAHDTGNLSGVHGISLFSDLGQGNYDYQRIMYYVQTTKSSDQKRGMKNVYICCCSKNRNTCIYICVCV